MATFFDFGKTFAQSYQAEKQRTARQKEAEAQRNFTAAENTKNRIQQKSLSKAQTDAALQRIKMQIAAANLRHSDTLSQNRAFHADSVDAETKKLSEQVSYHNKMIKLQNDQLNATANYNISSLYDKARDTQLAFEKQGIGGEIDMSSGYPRFVPTGKIKAQEPNVRTLADIPKPIRSQIPERPILGQILSLFGGGPQAIGYNLATELAVKKGLSEGIQAVDLKHAEKYAKTTNQVINDNPQSLKDPRTILALDALDKIINRSDFSKKEVETKLPYSNNRDIRAYINMLMSQQTNR